MTYPSFSDVLAAREAQQPERIVYRFLETGDVDGDVTELTYGELGRRVRSIAAFLRERGLTGRRALLLYPPGLEFVSGFLGCLAGAVVAVPAPLPRPGDFDRSLRRLRQVVADAGIDTVLSTRYVIDGVGAAVESLPELAALSWVATEEIPDDTTPWDRPALEADSVAFLQYTSGSTSAPRGVVVTHGNLLHNQQAIAEVMGHTPELAASWDGVLAVSWLPMFHDMGLIGPVLQTVYTGMSSVLFSPLHFLERPQRWLTAVSHYRAHTSGGPNFAYELGVRRASPEWVDSLDLGYWRVAFNGAEPVRADTLRRFADRFAPAGFRPEALQSVYGLAEATLLVSGTAIGSAPTVVERPRGDGDRRGAEVVGAGKPPSGVSVVIADLTANGECAEGEEGEIRVAGPSIARGYWGDEQATCEVFGGGRAGYLRTGDLGFVRAGELFVTGRHKDLLVIDGVNHYPQDLELTVEGAHGAVRPGCVAAFSADSGVDGEQPVVVAEVKPGAGEPAEIKERIRRAVSAGHGLALRDVVLIPPRTIFKTSSGKIQRHACRAAYLDGGYETDARARSEEPPATTAAVVTPESVRLWLVEAIAAQANLAPERVEADRPLAEFGLGSRGLVELVGRLSEFLGRRFDPSLLFEHPTISAVVDAVFPAARSAEAVPSVAVVDDPVVVVGVGCRLPGGVVSMDGLWELVARGGDATSEVPADRGWGAGGPVWRGGFLEGVAEFDAGFFRVGPREASAMDPQQRLMLEVSWEALERAGIDPRSLAGSATGVYTGVTYSDYITGFAGDAPQEVADYLSDNGTSSVASGRVAYVLGLEGPAVTVDTACSSSLVALHLAAQAVRSGECSLALAGGVTVMSTPAAIDAMARKRGLSPDGRCRAFAERADGTGFAEGAGAVVVERLSDAVRSGHPVLAVVAGSAVNQDGASNGLTAPNGPAQERVIRRALANAGLHTSDVDVVEAHGTGTTLGDPIEARALLATYGQDRTDDRPLWLGSVKSNIGHTQAAAGVAGVIKMIAAMQHGVLPATLHVDAPTNMVDWSAGGVELLTQPRAWPETGRPRRAGVSSFGVSGTNAHVILAQPSALPVPPVERKPLPVVPLVLSGVTAAAVSAQAERLVELWEQRPELDPTDIGFSLVTTRSTFTERAVVLGTDREQLLTGLRSLAAGESSSDVLRGRAAMPHRPVFLFSGHGSQWAGMAVELLDSSPVFAEQLGECAAVLDGLVDWSLVDVLRGVPGAPELDRLDVVQPVLFAVMVSLTRLWESVGVRPAAVIGHSQGEIAAAHVAGALSLPEASALMVRRGRALRALSGTGGMLTVALPVEQTRELLAGWEGRLAVGAVNSPLSTVVSGDSAAIEELRARCEADGVRTRRVAIRYASHAQQIDEVREELDAALAVTGRTTAEVAFFSTVTGDVLDTGALTGEYWYRNVREPVRFEAAVREAFRHGYRTFLEVGPHPVLTPAVEETLDSADPSVVVHVGGTLRRGDGGPTRFLRSAAWLHVAGTSPEWARWFAGSGATRVDLPTYPFQRQRYWLDAAGQRGAGGLGLTATGHPVLGAVVSQPASGGVVLTGRISVGAQPWLADHMVSDAVVFPAAGLLELALRAGDEVGATVVRELRLVEPMIVPPHQGLQVQVFVGASDGSGALTVSIHSRAEAESGARWLLHGSGTLAEDATPEPAPQPLPWPPAGAVAVQHEGFYRELSERGFRHGPLFRGLRSVWRLGADVLAEVALPEGAAAAGFGVHPALLDAVTQALMYVDSPADPDNVLVPAEWAGVSLYAVGASAGWVRLTSLGEGQVRVTLTDASGGLVAAIDSVALREVAVPELAAVTRRRGEVPLTVEWTEYAVPDGDLAPVVPVDIAEAGVAVQAGATPVLIVRDGGQRAGFPAEVGAETASVLARVQEWLAHARPDDVLVVCTSGAVATDAGEDVPGLRHAPVWGLLRSAQTEHLGRIVLVDVGDQHALPRAVALALASGEPQSAWRGGSLYLPRLTRAGSADGVVFDPAGTVLVTGGTGVLGALVARHLVVAHGVRHLVLAGRRGAAAPGAADLVAELTGLGAAVEVVACDMADRASVAALVAGVPSSRPLTAVIHTAGVVADASFEDQTAADVDSVFGPKVAGAWHLHELTEHLPLAAFVLYSSTSGLLGAPRHATYAAANSFLDALAQHRRSRGLVATALAWGAWAQAGGVTGHLDERTWARLSRTGARPMASDEALELFDAALAVDRPLVVLSPFDAAVMAKSGLVPPLYRGLVRPARRVADDSDHDPAAARFAARLAGLPPAKQEQLVLLLVRETAAAVLGHTSSSAVVPDSSFKDLGMDSLGAVEFRDRVHQATGVRLAAAAVFDHPTPTRLARHLRAEALRERVTAEAVPSVAVLDDPVVVVGVGCRLPGGVVSMDGLWELVARGGDATSEVPADRGWGAGGPVWRGGFLEGVAEFDAGFFRVGPREASAMDPQQRLMLEVSWEALERAGIDPRSLAGSATGVYTGVTYSDYTSRLHGRMPEEAADFMGENGTSSVASGRVAYVLGLEGPAVTVDTACSSSLVALHLAAQAVRSGECSLALAGGVTVMASSGPLEGLARKRGMSPDGRCRAFAEGADGTGFAEGAGAVVVERLSDAVRLGHPVLAVVAGSAVNQDGASNGLTAPNGPAQERVIRRALANAGLQTSDVDVVEAHGTGTTLGDPIEAGALLATYGQNRPGDRPLLLGSLKSNIGHTQAAAGVAGVIKMIAAMQHGVLPATLHVDAPTNMVDWSAGGVELLTQPRAWPETGRPRRAGVSSFGVSGTNAHVILAQPSALPLPPVERKPLPVVPLVLSGVTTAAVSAQAERLVELWEQRPELDPTDIGFSLVTTRSTFTERAVVLGTDREQLLTGLRSLADDELSGDAVRGRAAVSGKPVFVFPGQGTQWAGMAVELLDSSPVFAEQLGECAAVLDGLVDWSLVDVLRGVPGAPELDRLDVVQPVLFAVMVSLTRLWESVGVRPAAVIGHSQGEIVAAHVAGALSLPEAMRLVTLRAQALVSLSGNGAMTVVALPVDSVRERIAPWADRLDIAVVNSPQSTVVSGAVDAVDEFSARCAADGVGVTRVAARGAGHSRQIEPLRAELDPVLAVTGVSAPDIGFFSTVTGAELDTGVLDGAHWWRNVRETVQFEQAVRAAYRQGHRVFLEVSPHPALTMRIQETLDDEREEIFVGGSLRRNDGGMARLLRSAAELHVAGVELDWARYLAGAGATRVDLPTYAFQRRRYWLEPAAPAGDAGGFGLTEAHPFLGAVVSRPDGDGLVLTGRISSRTHPWLADHALRGAVLFPGTGFVELAIRAGDEVGATVLRELVLEAPLVLPNGEWVQFQVVVDPPDGTGDRAVSIHSRPGQPSGSAWVRHAQGTVSAEAVPPAAPELAQWPPAGAEAIEVDGFYQDLADHGYDYGPAFRGLRAAWRRGAETFAEITLPEDAARDAGKYGLHPALFDAALHTMAFSHGEDRRVRLPMGWNDVRLSAAGAVSLRVRMTAAGPDTVSLVAADQAGTPVVRVESLVVREVSATQIAAATAAGCHQDLFRLDWQPVCGGPAGTVPASVVVETPAGDSAAAVHAATRDLLAVLKSELADDASTATLLVRTRRAVALPGEDVRDLAGAAVWGMVRSAQSEHPGRIVLVDTDDADGTDTDDLDAAAVLATGEPQLVVRDGTLYGARMVRLAAGREPSGVGGDALRGGSVLVTGAPGGIGSVVARHLVTEHGVGRLLLASRRGMAAPGAEELCAELVELGAKVEIVRCDVTDRGELAALLSGERLAGVVHSAAVLDDATIASMTAEQLDRVLRPKVDAALHLHELTAGMDLSLFALFSSAAGTLGNPGQANYAAANTFLDALATRRAAHGLPAHSLAWGLWELTSADNLADADRARMLRRGVRAMSPSEGMALFDAALSLNEAVVVPARLDFASFTGTEQHTRLLSGLLPPRTRRANAAEPAADPAAGPKLAARLAGLSEEDAVGVVLDLIRAKAAAVLGGSPGELDPSGTFQQFGFDSLMTVELRNGLRAVTGLPLPVTAIFEHPSPVALARHLVDELGSAPAPVAVAPPAEHGTEVPEVVRYPATRDVMRLLRTGQQGVPSAAHTVAMAVRLSRRVTRDELEGVLAGLAARHAALRTAILPGTQHTELQVRRAPAGSLLRWSEVGDCAHATVQDRVRELLEPPFDLTTSPLWRFELLDSGNEQVLVFGAHHSVSDGQSMLLVAAEIDAALHDGVPDLAVSDQDIEALVEAQRVEGGDDMAKAAWAREFTGVRRLDLTLARPRPAVRSYRAGACFLALPDGALDRIAERARELGITPAAFFLGALTVLLARRQQRSRFVLAVPVDTRIHTESPAGVGYFGVPVPFPATVENGEPAAEVLRRTGGKLHRLLGRGAGFSDTLATLAAEGLHRENAPMVEVYFNYLKSGAAFRGAEPVPVGPGYSDLDLMVTVLPDGNQVCFYYNLDIIDEAACAELGADYLAVLGEITGNPEAVATTAVPEPQIALAATFALGRLPELCRLAFGDCGVVEAPYHHLLAALRDPAGVLAAPSTEVGVLLLRAADLERFGALNEDQWTELEHAYPAAARALAERTRKPLIVGFLPSCDTAPRLERWERTVGDALRDVPGIAVVDATGWPAEQAADRFDERTEAMGHLPFTPEFQAAVAIELGELVSAVREAPPKVIAVDGDETLWGGVADEFGPETVELGGPRAVLARRLLRWRDAGALLVLVSNNDEATVRAVLDRPDALVRAEHFSVLSTGWQPKAERLEAVATELGLGLDSFVFLDDNPVEVAALRAALPEVLTLTCPGADELEAFLTRLWPLVPSAVTPEDAVRAEFYRHERERDEVRARTEFAEFLADLRLEVEVVALTEATVERAAQLVRRTNQFALREVDDGELVRWRRDGEVWTASARDRFGDYGVIGLLAIRSHGEELRVAGWHLSCRALGRGVEERLLGWLARRAETLGCRAVRLTAEATPRNVPARRLIAALGGADADADELDVTVATARLRAFRSWEQR
ncbi:SDR family NAD(P)-dependent oxidoreductase [Streptomyces sp. NPDC059122]|uniref:SDR family NAD(P)-dependent oxidoreductase n=1 Tax=Streptomyces sp. NPDC059122 TaxID=3346732 RepID=UPI00369E9CC3